MNSPNLPNGWAETTLGEIHQDFSGGINPAQFPDERFELYSVPGHATGEPEVVTGSQIGSNKQTVSESTVLLCKINPRINRVWVVQPKTGHRTIASTEWIPFSPRPEINPGYLAYFLRQREVRDFLAQRASGVGGSLMRVKSSTLRDFPFVLAPRKEQGRIVGEIEKQFTRLDAATAALKRVQANLKRYRASVLKAACEGRLVPTEAELARKEGRDYEPADQLLQRILRERRARWEADTLAKMIASGKPPKDDRWKQKYKEPTGPDTANPTILPEGWTWTSIDHIAECLDSKRVPVNKEERARRGGDIPYYGANGRVGWIDDFLFDEPLVLVVEDETFVGRQIPFSYVIRGKAWVNNHAHILRPHVGILVEFLNYSLAYYPFTALTTGSTGRRKLTQQALMAAPYPLPPLQEQIRIVAEIERRLSVDERMGQTLTASFGHGEALRQSILKEAFSGGLLPQNSNDEPASVLLERIRAYLDGERASSKSRRKEEPTYA